MINETDLSAIPKKTSQETRLSSPLKDSRGKEGPQEEKKKGPEATRPSLIRRSEARGVELRQGGPWKGNYLGLWVTERASSEGPSEWKIVVSRKVIRLATERNRWKRRIREVLRRREGSLRPGCCARLKVLQGGTEVGYAKLEEEISELLTKSGLWR